MLPNNSSLITAIQNNNLQEVRRILASPEVENLLNKPDSLVGNTPLQWAVFRGKDLFLGERPSKVATDIVKLLIDAGADPNVVNREGKTALEMAGKMNSETIHSMLLEYKRQRRLGLIKPKK